METQIRCIRKNIMGTISFEMKTSSMRKFQEFIVYPKHSGDNSNIIKIQSNTRIGLLDTVKNIGKITKSIPSGAYGVHLSGHCETLSLQDNDLKSLKLAIMDSYGELVGNSACKTDNSAAFNVL